MLKYTENLHQGLFAAFAEIPRSAAVFRIIESAAAINAFPKAFAARPSCPTAYQLSVLYRMGIHATMTGAPETTCFQIGHLVQQGNRKDSRLDNRWISKLYSYFCSLFLTPVHFGNELSCLLLARRSTSGVEKIKSFLELSLRWGGRHSYTMRKLRCRVRRAGVCYSLG